MAEITYEELINISGGGKKGIWTAVGVVLSVLGTLIAGIIDGYLRPLKCNK